MGSHSLHNTYMETKNFNNFYFIYIYINNGFNIVMDLYSKVLNLKMFLNNNYYNLLQLIIKIWSYQY